MVVSQHLSESSHRYPQATIHRLAFLVDTRGGELVLHAHDDRRRVGLSDAEPFPSLRAEVQP